MKAPPAKPKPIEKPKPKTEIARDQQGVPYPPASLPKLPPVPAFDPNSVKFDDPFKLRETTSAKVEEKKEDLKVSTDFLKRNADVLA